MPERDPIAMIITSEMVTIILRMGKLSSSVSRVQAPGTECKCYHSYLTGPEVATYGTLLLKEQVVSSLVHYYFDLHGLSSPAGLLSMIITFRNESYTPK